MFATDGQTNRRTTSSHKASPSMSGEGLINYTSKECIKRFVYSVKRHKIGVKYRYLLVSDRTHEDSPFLHDLTQIYGVQRNGDLPDLIVLRKTIEVIDGQRQSFRSHLGVRQLPIEQSQSMIITGTRNDMILPCKYCTPCYFSNYL